MKDYAALAMDTVARRYALAGGFYYGGCYAFIAGTPFAYVDYYQVSAQAYGLLFGANILGLMVLNFVVDAPGGEVNIPYTRRLSIAQNFIPLVWIPSPREYALQYGLF